MKLKVAFYQAVAFLLVWALAPLGTAAQGQPKNTENAAKYRPRIISLSSTSFSPDSSPLNCLLDPLAEGYWSPQSDDGAVNEGIYLRFEEPVHINYIMLELESADYVGLQTYLDANSGFLTERMEDGKYLVSYYDYETVEERYEGVDANGEAYVEIEEYTLRVTGLPINRDVRSVFIKIAENKNGNRIKLKKIKFYAQNEFSPDAEPMPIELPLGVQATARASSTLEPVFAYDASRLFDSRLGMAWSTDGKKTSGKGESVSISFTAPQDIAGLMIWNGYQRSDTHYNANGRVKILDAGSEALAVKDEPGAQTIMLKKPRKLDELTLTVKDIYPGSSYKDVLVSELRLIALDGRILLPDVQAPAPDLPDELMELTDRSYAGFVHGSMNSVICHESSIRLRSNGTFVIYTDTQNIGMNTYTRIIEGNWEPRKGARGIRLFGKRYAASLAEYDGGYLPYGDDADYDEFVTPRIFQSNMSIGRFNDLSAKEQLALARYIVEQRTMDDYYRNEPDYAGGVGLFTTYNNGGSYDALGYSAGYEGLPAALAEDLRSINPVYVKSDVYTNVLMPQHVVSSCAR